MNIKIEFTAEFDNEVVALRVYETLESIHKNLQVKSLLRYEKETRKQKGTSEAKYDCLEFKVGMEREVIVDFLEGRVSYRITGIKGSDNYVNELHIGAEFDFVKGGECVMTIRLKKQRSL